MRLASCVVICAVTFLTGCTISQSVRPVASDGLSEVCIVVNPDVRPGFLDTYVRVLGSKGYRIRKIPSKYGADQCPAVSTYTGLWSWNLALYLSYAEIVVYKNGRLAGLAVYDSRKGRSNMNKFIKADEKITELANELFPGPAKP